MYSVVWLSKNLSRIWTKKLFWSLLNEIDSPETILVHYEVEGIF